ELIKELLAYPYWCLEQTTSRLVAVLFSNEADRQADLDKGYSHLSSLQKIDGSFGLWSMSGATEPWLTLYVADLLDQVKVKGLIVPSALSASVNNWIKDIQQMNIRTPQDISLIAYAHYLRAKQDHGDLRSLRFFVDNQQANIVNKQDLAFIGAAF